MGIGFRLTTSEIGPPHKVESQVFNPAAPLQMSQTDAIITTYVNSRIAGKKTQTTFQPSPVLFLTRDNLPTRASTDAAKAVLDS